MTSKVDVIVLTRDSERWLNDCLESIYKYVPINRLIVVDGQSNDKTLEILDGFQKRYRNIKIMTHVGSRGQARERGIKEVVTDWFMFVDSDVVLCDDWFEKVKKHMNEDVGAIWGVDIIGDLNSKFLISIFKWMEAKVFDIRGGCHDIIIKRDCVKDIRIPVQLHTLEDAYIKDWIIAKHHRVLVAFDPYCRHYKTVSNMLSKESLFSLIREIKTSKLVRKRFIFAVIFGFTWFLQEIKFAGRLNLNLKKSGGFSEFAK